MEDKILKLIYEVVDEINEGRPEESKLKKSPDTGLFGGSGGLNSLTFIRFITATEEKIEEEMGKTLTLAHEDAFSQKNNPFSTIKTLADYIASLLAKE
ncbi:acyl carrier protein [Candidatus Woesearchaeota archaeon]|nr:acyl carrier protein [Candidatus Woesearchaeota archaeon]